MSVILQVSTVSAPDLTSLLVTDKSEVNRIFSDNCDIPQTCCVSSGYHYHLFCLLSFPLTCIELFWFKDDTNLSSRFMIINAAHKNRSNLLSYTDSRTEHTANNQHTEHVHSECCGQRLECTDVHSFIVLGNAIKSQSTRLRIRAIIVYSSAVDRGIIKWTSVLCPGDRCSIVDLTGKSQGFLQLHVDVASGGGGRLKTWVQSTIKGDTLSAGGGGASTVFVVCRWSLHDLQSPCLYSS